ncbi:MAG TPA: hypothetical protein VIY47_04730 [Ignavibacteriaceae bacterium]
MDMGIGGIGKTMEFMGSAIEKSKISDITGAILERQRLHSEQSAMGMMVSKVGNFDRFAKDPRTQALMTNILGPMDGVLGFYNTAKKSLGQVISLNFNAPTSPMGA